MRRIAWTRLGAWALALFFVTGAVTNLLGSPEVLAEYARWGYPSWFHYVTGIFELTTAALLARQWTRRSGVVLGLMLMGGAASTVLLNGEQAHAAVPAAVAIVLLWLGRASRRRR